MQILMGLVIVVIGVLYTIYSTKIADVVGTIGWAEDKLGPGGTYKLHILVGIILIIIGILWTSGTFQWLLASSLGRLFGGVKHP